MPLSNIHINKGRYPQSGDEDLNVSTISDISQISQVYADNQCSMQWGSKQLYPQLYHMYIGRSDKTLIINMYMRPSVCNPIGYQFYFGGLANLAYITYGTNIKIFITALWILTFIEMYIW